jgi:hypothetical protein
MVKHDARIAAQIALAGEMVSACREVFADQDPDAVGVALGELLSIFIASHHPVMRTEALAMVVALARDLVAVEVEKMIGQGRVGADWRDGAAKQGATRQ